MSNASRQPVVQKATSGSKQYSDSTANAVVGKTTRVEVMTVDQTPSETVEIAPRAPWDDMGDVD